MKRTIVNPHWINNARTVLAAQFHYDDGRIVEAVISQTDTSNTDLAEILNKFSQSQLEDNTAANIKKVTTEQAAAEQKKQDEIERIRAERLFAAKLEVFEVEAIKNSTNRKLKSRIRRSSSVVEVGAWAAALLLSDFNAAEITEVSTSE